jgi:hypothetical protein
MAMRQQLHILRSTMLLIRYFARRPCLVWNPRPAVPEVIALNYTIDYLVIIRLPRKADGRIFCIITIRFTNSVSCSNFESSQSCHISVYSNSLPLFRV